MSEIRPLTQIEWQGIDKKVAELMREPITFTRLPKAASVGMGKREAEYYEATDMKYVEEGQTFNYDDKNVAARKIRSNKITYLTLPIHIDEVMLAASEGEGITSLLIQAEIEARAEMLERIEKIVFHGSTRTLGQGMTNFTGLGTSAAAGVWTTAGNFFVDLETAISSLRGNHILPPYTLITTPGVPAELRGNNISAAGGYKNEWEAFLDIYMNKNDGVNPIIEDFVASDAIVNATLAVNNQAFILFKNDPNCVYIAESYSIHRANAPMKKFEGDIDYAIRWAGCFIPKNPNAVYLVTGGTTASAY